MYCLLSELPSSQIEKAQKSSSGGFHVVATVDGSFFFCVCLVEGRSAVLNSRYLVNVCVSLRQLKCENAAVGEQNIITCLQRACTLYAFGFLYIFRLVWQSVFFKAFGKKNGGVSILFDFRTFFFLFTVSNFALMNVSFFFSVFCSNDLWSQTRCTCINLYFYF